MTGLSTLLLLGLQKYGVIILVIIHRMKKNLLINSILENLSRIFYFKKILLKYVKSIDFLRFSVSESISITADSIIRQLLHDGVSLTDTF